MDDSSKQLWFVHAETIGETISDFALKKIEKDAISGTLLDSN
jgi:hypothetical protein